MKCFIWVFVGSVALKGVDAWMQISALAAAPWFLSAGIACIHRRVGMLLVAVTALGSANAGLASMGSHAVLVGSVAAIFAAFEDVRTQVFLLRTQLFAMYLFAGLNKSNRGFLDGSVIARQNEWIVAPRVMAILAVAIELWLAIAVLKRWRSAIPVAVAFHTGIVIGWTTGFNLALELIIFNGLAVAGIFVVTRTMLDHGVGHLRVPLLSTSRESSSD